MMTETLAAPGAKTAAWTEALNEGVETLLSGILSAKGFEWASLRAGGLSDADIFPAPSNLASGGSLPQEVGALPDRL